MASAMNICVGFTGYLPFGYVVFYGVGAYATGICYKILGWPILPSLLAAGGTGVAIALLLAPTPGCAACISASSAWRWPPSSSW